MDDRLVARDVVVETLDRGALISSRHLQHQAKGHRIDDIDFSKRSVEF